MRAERSGVKPRPSTALHDGALWKIHITQHLVSNPRNLALLLRKRY